MAGIGVEEVRKKWKIALSKYSLESIVVPINEALGYILAESIIAKTDIPAFRKSPYDGYALTYEPNCKEYKVIDVIGAGVDYKKNISKGECIKIMTGAPVPDSCDTIIMQEQCVGDGRIGTTISIQGNHVSGENIIPQGEECKCGQTVVEPGLCIDAGIISMAVGLGYTEISVYKPLTAAVITSGKEIIEPGNQLEKGQIFNSNRYLLTGLLRAAGINNISYCHISDDPTLLEKEIERVRTSIDTVDIVISTGGVSVGVFDYMPSIFERLGGDSLYRRIMMRPGAASYGCIRERYVGHTKKLQCIWGLSGNPAAAYNSWYLLALPTIYQLQGRKCTDLSVMTCKLEVALTKKNPVDRYVQGQIILIDGKPIFRPNKLFSGSALLGLQAVNGLAKLPQGTMHYEVGDEVSVIILR